jgi:hypothetical protein
LYVGTQTAPNASTWTGWQSLGGTWAV